MPQWRNVGDPSTRIVLLPTTRPVAVPADKVNSSVLNVPVGSGSIVLFRDRETGRVNAFDAQVEDLLLKFRANTDGRRRGVFMIDDNTKSGWGADGKVVDGRLAQQGVHLAPFAAEEGLYWGVMKFWMSDLQLAQTAP
jgi:hypothetical protein